MPTLFWFARQIGFVGCIVLALLAFYEGVPFLNGIPGVGYVPVAREVLQGRVATVANEAVKRATAGLVQRAELIAARAELAEMQRQVTIATQLADAARKQADRATIETRGSLDALDQRIARDTDDADLRWDQRSLERLRNDRGR